MSTRNKTVSRSLLLILFTYVSINLACSSSISKEGNALFENSGEAVLRDSILIKKAFPLFEILNQERDFKMIIKTNETFLNIQDKLTKRLEKSLNQNQDVSSYAAAIQWNDKEIQSIGDELINLYQTENSFKKIIPELKKEGRYKFYEKLPDTALIRNAWQDAALGINNILATYVQGKEPLYPAIDSISFNTGDESFKEEINEGFQKSLQTSVGGDNLFFELPLDAALTALVVNGRDEAIRYEPLDKGYNEAPVQKVDSINWEDYPYSVILVPGQGPDAEGVSLDSLSMYRCQLAVERYENKMAPFLVVSGGHVHPNKTPYSEAVEMKKFLTENFKIPEEDVLIEPHARHTTTNLRNTSRMIYRFGIPFQKPVLIVTSSGQNQYINGKMGPRGKKELGYFPFKKLKKRNINESEFYPSLNALQANPFDILDP